jgi:hypothetical protein
VGSLYIIVLASKYARRWVSGNRSLVGWVIVYQFLSGIMRIVMVVGSCWAAKRAQ